VPVALSRRHDLLNAASGVIAIATGAVSAPSVLRAQGAAIKIGVLHPVSGALSYSGRQGRLGTLTAIEDINAAGGIKALGSAKIEAMSGDAQSTPEGASAEVEKMNAAGVVAIVGGYGSSICLSASQTAARYDLPYLVDVGVVDSIVTRGLKNTFRFGPGFGVVAKTALDNLVAINDHAGRPAKTAIIVNEDSGSRRRRHAAPADRRAGCDLSGQGAARRDCRRRRFRCRDRRLCRRLPDASRR
jgi:branched-chain amino acid transport system substrate-binding protein